ncbi:BRO1 domain-containing protein BROX-like [Prorops nasuta]|uniref:BRO1 domain-containing protein BROX-like n=1 Tax=Prorops nasuta TaxID=863751 RepID=UPI0034CFBA93
MAHWFHRNVLKATFPQKFEIKIAHPTNATKKLCSDLKLSRTRLLDLIRNSNNTKDSVEPAFHNYLSLLYGFIWEIQLIDQGQSAGRPNPSQLRNILVFQWTNSLLGLRTFSRPDFIYEAASMSVNIGLWFMKHAAMIAGKDDITMNEAKEVHTMLRHAAGIFTFIQTEFLPQLNDPPTLESDLDPRVLNAYINQCTAEAQEVTVARAVELKHNANLISALANGTSKLFLDAANTLRPFKPNVSLQWIKYLELKAAFYHSYAYNYCGEYLLSLEKCGEAVKAMQESEIYLKKAKLLCQEYGNINGPAPRAKPDEHSVFRRLGPLVKLNLDKSLRENSLIYHQLVPAEVPTLFTKATFGLVSPIDFQMPQPNSIWHSGVYETFIGISAATIGKEQNLPPVKEQEIHQSNKDPKNESGCMIQ